jgi:Concanavalin A-like lectin/glucanases superfamily/IPT/TIG domain
MTQSFQQLLVTNYGLQPSGYTGSQGVQGIAGTSGGPKISAVQVTDSSGTVLDDTAVDVAGGYILLTGSGFESGCQVVINTTPAVSTTFVSATQVRAQVPATTAGTYIVYLVNADGGVAIRINGITFSATPAWVTGSSLTGDSDVAISIQLSAAGAVSYSLATGSTLPAGLTLSAGGLLSGTVTGLELETVYNFTVNATDGELQDSPRSFSITISAGDLQIAYVTTLLSPEMEVLPFNRDASSNNFPISVVGDTRPNSFGPYTPGYYSNFFDGNNDYLTPIVNVAFTIGTGDFTYECWINRQGVNPVSSSNVITVFDTRTAEPSVAPCLFWENNALKYYVNGSNRITSTSTFPIGTWAHVAIVRSSGITKMYVNGVQEGVDYIDANNYVGTTTVIGGRFASVSGDFRSWFGYISNARIVKGTAVYTTNFTPPTEPLTAITNTSLLTCQSNRFIDNSANNFAITRNGDVRIDGFGPFVPSTEFAGRGSTYFDGTGDYLNAPANTAFEFGTGDFTIELFFYRTVSGTFDTVLQYGAAVVSSYANISWGFYVPDTNYLSFELSNGVGAPPAVLLVSNVLFPTNSWVHASIVRAGNNFTLYQNGNAVSTITSSASVYVPTSPLLWIGRNHNAGTADVAGYISNVRVIKGTALYTANFTAPTEPLTAIANTSLLTCQTNQPVNNNVFLDSSTNNFLITRNGNTTQGAFSPYGGGWSNYFDGNGDELTVANNAAFNFGSGNFTVECWFNLTADATGNLDGNKNAFLFGPGQIVSNEAWLMELGGNSVSSGVAITFQARNTSGTPTILSYTANFTKNTWYHVAASRAGNTLLLFVDGVKVAENTNWTLSVNSGGSLLRIGRRAISSNYEHYFPGYISNVRVVKGTAVYTANFTPSTAPLQPITGTSLLTCASNRFRDASTNNFTVTRVGDVGVQKFNPFGLVNASGVRTSYTPAVYGGSMYFDGTGDYISNTSSNSLNFGTGAFTVEMWLYANTISTTQFQVAMTTNPQSNGGFQIYNRDINTSLVFGGINVSEHTIISNMIPRQWYHIAISRVSTGTNQTFVFVNGALTNTLTVSDNYNINGFNLGGYNASIFWHGYISNVRVVRGTAVYTSSFVPPTAPLEPITNTTLLLNGTAAAVRDASMSNNLETVGDARVTTAVVRYGDSSMVFNGSSLAVIPYSPILHLSSDFTIECWFRANSYGGMILNFAGGLNIAWASYELVNNTDGINFAASSANNGYNIGSETGTTGRIGTITLSTWNHLAVTRSGNIYRGFVNGLQGYTQTLSLTPYDPGSRGLTVGGNYSTTWATGTVAGVNGNISDLRITRGLARYTANFTPPAAAFKTK